MQHVINMFLLVGEDNETAYVYAKQAILMESGIRYSLPRDLPRPVQSFSMISNLFFHFNYNTISIDTQLLPTSLFLTMRW